MLVALVNFSYLSDVQFRLGLRNSGLHPFTISSLRRDLYTQYDFLRNYNCKARMLEVLNNKSVVNDAEKNIILSTWQKLIT